MQTGTVTEHLLPEHLLPEHLVPEAAFHQSGSGHAHSTWRLSYGTPIVYVFGVLLVLCIPFVLPLALTQAVRVIDRSISIAAQGNAFVSQGKTESVRADADKISGSTDMVEKGVEIKQATRDGSRNEKGFNFDKGNIGDKGASRLQGQVDSDERRGVGTEKKMMYRTQDGVVSREVWQPQAQAPDEDVINEWRKYGVVRHGRLYLSETFEWRLNNEISPHLNGMKSRLFRSTLGRCKEKTSIRLSLNLSPRVKGRVEVLTRCGRESSSCLVQSIISDVRRLHVNVRGEEGHFLTADAGNGESEYTWGPVVGGLKVEVADESMVVVRLVCGGVKVVGSRVMSVRRIKELMKEIGQDGLLQVFRYNGRPKQDMVVG